MNLQVGKETLAPPQLIADCRFTDCQLPIADCQLVLLLNLELRYTSNRRSAIDNHKKVRSRFLAFS